MAFLILFALLGTEDGTHDNCGNGDGGGEQQDIKILRPQPKNIVLRRRFSDTLKILCNQLFFIDIEVFGSRLFLGDIGTRRASIRIVPQARRTVKPAYLSPRQSQCLF